MKIKVDNQNHLNNPSAFYNDSKQCIKQQRRKIYHKKYRENLKRTQNVNKNILAHHKELKKIRNKRHYENKYKYLHVKNKLKALNIDNLKHYHLQSC